MRKVMKFLNVQSNDKCIFHRCLYCPSVGISQEQKFDVFVKSINGVNFTPT